MPFVFLAAQRGVAGCLQTPPHGDALALETKGSHRQFHHPTKPGTVTIAGKPSVDVPPGTLNSVLKQAGLKE